MLKNFGGLMKQAQEMQKKIAKIQEDLEKHQEEGQSGGGMVTVQVTGKMVLKSVKIDPNLLNRDEVEVLEDFIVAAFNDAKSKVDHYSQSQMGSIPGLPGGMNLPF